MNRESIETLARSLAASLPEGLRVMRADIEENFRAVLKSNLARMDLVTREEFEVQESVLRRTREKLEAIEARLTAFEASGKNAAVQEKRKKQGKKKGKGKKKKKTDA